MSLGHVPFVDDNVLKLYVEWVLTVWGRVYSMAVNIVMTLSATATSIMSCMQDFCEIMGSLHEDAPVHSFQEVGRHEAVDAGG